jgi:hypothetical protein
MCKSIAAGRETQIGVSVYAIGLRIGSPLQSYAESLDIVRDTQRRVFLSAGLDQFRR